MTTFYTAPEIYLLSRPEAANTYLWSGDPAYNHEALDSGSCLAETAGRSCYWSYGKGRKTNAEYIKNIVSSGHGSVLEHPSWTFGLRGISRSLTHELVRHRHLSFSQLSQRYVTEEPEFVVPPLLLSEPEHLQAAAGDAFRQACREAAKRYRDLCTALPDSKAGRECARSVLPNATATRIVVTGNARALRQMLSLRGSAGADAEFRRLAVRWTQFMKTEAPNLFYDFSIADGCVVCENPRT
jgi:thymidylate synthase (FAD)